MVSNSIIISMQKSCIESSIKEETECDETECHETACDETECDETKCDWTSKYTHEYVFNNLSGCDDPKKNGLIQNKWNRIFITKYDRKNLQTKDYKTKGLFRSVIHSNGVILAFSPPKSIDFNEFEREYPFEIPL